MNTEVESLGNLASHAELQAASYPEHSHERESWANTARRYRTAQEGEILKDTFQPEPYPLANVVTEGPSVAFRFTCYGLLVASVALFLILIF